MTEPTLCIYHGNCPDGFGAAWAVRAALGDINFYAGFYQAPPPDIKDRDVVIVDFSYKRPVLLEMAAIARSILILDHHKTAQSDLTDLPGNVSCRFDMGQSGAMLTWRYFHGDAEPPALLRHIEDRDLWRFDLPGTREIHASVTSYPYDINELLAAGKHDMVIAGYLVPAANLPYVFASDAGNAMAQGHPFAACYWDTPDWRMFSLHSTQEGVDVSEIAKRYGGGGHRNASGFKIPRTSDSALL